MSVDVTGDILFTIFKCTHFQEIEIDRLCDLLYAIQVHFFSGISEWLIARGCVEN